MATKEPPPQAATIQNTTPQQQRKEPPVVLIEENNNDEQDEEVRRLAASLAPQVQELDDLLTSPPPLDSARGSRVSLDVSLDEDDGMGSEEQNLEASEQLLRQELEFAQDWSHLMASPLRDDHIARELAINYGIQDEETLTEPEELTPRSYTLANHAETLGLEVDGGWYVVNTKLATDVLEYVVPLSVEQLKRLYIGLTGEQGEVTPAEPSNVEEEHVASPSLQTPKNKTPASSRRTSTSRAEALPVRTVVVWIRADVLCGAVMDAIYHSLDTIGEVIKRQGGHLRGIVKPCVLTNTDTGRVTHCPGYLVDVQLCTYKGTARNKQGQRSLILRVFHCYHEILEDDYHGEEESLSCETTADESSNALLKEAAALVQKMETGSTDMTKRSPFASIFSPSKVYTGEQQMREAISQKLLLGYRPCPSVLDGRLTLPALSEQDAPVINASWRWIDACWNELENRDLCYMYVYDLGFVRSTFIAQA